MTPAVDPKPMSRITAIAYAVISPLVFVALVFLPVGRLDWIPGWIFLAVFATAFGLSALLIARFNPVIFRARSRFQPGTKTWDLILVALILAGMGVEIPVATLDAGREGWSDVPGTAVVIGYLLLTAGIAVTAWAQLVNPFFEPGVRIQTERAHRVITSGPYRIVRHPGYAAAMAFIIGTPLALASWWALLPAVTATALLILRTSWEDRLLQAGLSGYAAYARQTRHRLVPGLW
jgi:protein-S-isoprenylcysteine O-methyltransferase Ste14